MQTFSFQQNTGFNTGSLIKRNQLEEADHDGIRSAVRAWAAAEGQDVVSVSGGRRAAGRSTFLMTSAVPGRSFFVTWIIRLNLSGTARTCVFLLRQSWPFFRWSFAIA